MDTIKAEKPRLRLEYLDGLRHLLLPAEGRARYGRTALLFALIAVPILLAFLLARGAFDFDCYWVGSWAVRDGKAAQMYAVLDTPDAQGYYDLANNSPTWNALAAAHLNKPHQLWGFIYPPPCAVLFLPLTFLPRTAALLGWRLLNLAAYVTGLLMLLYLVRARFKPLEAQTLLFAALIAPPLLVALSIGQITPLIFLTVAAGIYFAQTDRPVAAGISLAVGTLLKITPVLFAVWLLARRQYRALVAGAITLVVVSGVSALITGPAAFRQFFGHCLPLLSRGAISDTNVSAMALFGRALGLGDPHSAQILPQDTRLTLFKLGFYGLVLILSAVVLWRAGRAETGEQAELEFALVNMVALLLSPITWGHHLVLAVVTLVFVIAAALRQARKGLLIAALAAVVLMLQNHDLPGSLLPTAWGAAASLAGLIWLWILVCSLLNPAPRPQVSR